MKKATVFILCLLASALLLACLPIRGEESIYSSVVRLHVLAASDTARDQADKLAVRDRVLAEYGDLLSSASTAQEAADLLNERLSEIGELSRLVLKERGRDASVSVTLEWERFERREYGALTVPSGTYLSLRIVIGEGEGQNWWCVLYPPLCTEAAMGEYTSADGYFTPAEEELIVGDTVIRLRFLEILEAIFG